MHRSILISSLALVMLAACARPSGSGTFETSTPTQTPNNGAASTATATQTPTTEPIYGGLSSGGVSSAGGQPSGDGINPFEDPPPDMDRFPVPEEVPPDAGQWATPREGPWTALNDAGSLSCPGVMETTLPKEPEQQGRITILQPGQSFVASGLGSIETGMTANITFTANPPVQGRYIGTATISQGGDNLTIIYHLIIIWPENMVGYLESDYSFQDVQCHVERTFELIYNGS